MILQIQTWAKEHKVVIILAVLFSILIAFPQLYFRIDHRSDGVYKGIELIPDSPWSARAREVQDGHPNFGAIYYKDGKDSPYVFQPFGSMVVGYMGQMFGLEINNTILLSRFVLSFVTFLLAYAFVFLISRDKLLALSSTCLLLIADSVLSFSGLSRLLHGLSPESFIRMSRPVNPAMVYILLFAFLVSFWFFYEKKNWKWGIAATVFLGLNFYNYFYSWTYLFAFGGILGLFLLFQKRWKEAFGVASVYIGSIIIGIFYIINLLKVTHHPEYLNASMRSGIVFTHVPLFVGFSVLIGLGIYALGFPRVDKQKYLFGLALLLAPFLTMNQQLLTGKILQAAHYHWFFHKPMAVIFILAVVFYFLTKKGFDFYKKGIAIAIIVVSFGVGVFVQVSSYFVDSRDGGVVAIERQKYGPVMDWLNTNSREGEVVLSNHEISHLTVIYTPLDVYYHGAAVYSLVATKERLLDVLFTFYRLRNIKEQDIDSVFNKERGSISSAVHGIYYRELTGKYDLIPDSEIALFANLYKKTLTTQRVDWLRAMWKRYEVSYVIWDRKANPDWQMTKLPYLKEMATFGDITIYRFINDKN